MSKSLDLTGERYGRLLVDARSTRTSPSGRREVVWSCKCDCGGNATVMTNNLTRGTTRSCGCLQRERSSAGATTHGKSHTRLFGVYRAMIARCENKNVKKFEYYGGRGIKVCAKWRKSFEAFAADVGDRPTPAHSLDRIDNDGNYEPGNIRWATHSEQSKNRRAWGSATEAGGLSARVAELTELLTEVRKWMDADMLGPWEAELCAKIDAALSAPKAARKFNGEIVPARYE